MKVRPATAEDFETLWQIDQNCFPPGIAYGREELQWYMKLPRAFALVGESKGKIVGFVLVSIAQVKAKKRGAGAAESTIESVGHIITIDVLAKWRRDGVGSKLLDPGRRSTSPRRLQDGAAGDRSRQRFGYPLLQEARIQRDADPAAILPGQFGRVFDGEEAVKPRSFARVPLQERPNGAHPRSG